jgi:hypothetical protein
MKKQNEKHKEEELMKDGGVGNRGEQQETGRRPNWSSEHQPTESAQQIAIKCHVRQRPTTHK